MSRHNLIHHSHHGSVAGKGTQTLVQEIYSNLLQYLEDDIDSVFIQLNQSKAYDVFDHDLLLQKMSVLGFNTKTLNIFKSYLSERLQYVVVDSFESDKLLHRDLVSVEFFT